MFSVFDNENKQNESAHVRLFKVSHNRSLFHNSGFTGTVGIFSIFDADHVVVGETSMF